MFPCVHMCAKNLALTYNIHHQCPRLPHCFLHFNNRISTKKKKKISQNFGEEKFSASSYHFIFSCKKHLLPCHLGNQKTWLHFQHSPRLVYSSLWLKIRVASKTTFPKIILANFFLTASMDIFFNRNFKLLVCCIPCIHERVCDSWVHIFSEFSLFCLT